MKVTKLTSCMNFRMIQVVIKCFERSTVERIEENLKDVSPVLFSYTIMPINAHIKIRPWRNEEQKVGK